MKRTKLTIVLILVFIVFLILLPFLAEMNVLGTPLKYLKSYFSSDSLKLYCQQSQF